MVTLLNLLDLPIDEREKQGLLHTPREIAQQPQTWHDTFELFVREQEQIRSFLGRAGIHAGPEVQPTVLLIGAGTSDYIGHSLVLLLRQRWGCEVVAVASTDLLTNLADFVIPGRPYLFVSFSRSGDSPEGLNVVEQTVELYPEIFHLIVSCNPAARMFKAVARSPRALTFLLADSVNDRSLAMTSSFTNMVVFGQCLAHAWAVAEFGVILESMIEAARTFLTDSAALADNLTGKRWSRICMIGSGSLAAIAKESSLKVLELSGGNIKTMSETSLGLRHGPMAALDTGTALLCFLSSERVRNRYELDLLREIRAKQITAGCVVVGLEADRETASPLCDHYLAIEGSFPDRYRPPVDVIFGQLLGLYASLSFGLRPDAPSPAGVISRVVNDFTIYR